MRCNTVPHATDEGGGAGGVTMRSKQKARPRGRRCERRLCVSVETSSRRASDASDHNPAGRNVLPGCSNCLSDSRANGSLVSLPNNQIEHQYQRTIYQKQKTAVHQSVSKETLTSKCRSPGNVSVDHKANGINPSTPGLSLPQCMKTIYTVRRKFAKRARNVPRQGPWSRISEHGADEA